MGTRRKTASVRAKPTRAQIDRFIAEVEAAIVRVQRGRIPHKGAAKMSHDDVLAYVRNAGGAIPPGPVMAMRWATLRGAVDLVGRATYGPNWDSAVFFAMEHFPLHASERDEALGNDEEGYFTFLNDVWTRPARGPAWGRALGAYALLLEALAEGLVTAVREDFDHARSRAPIVPEEWRAGRVVPDSGLTIAHFDRLEHVAMVFVERTSLVGLLRDYAGLSPAIGDAAARNRGGRPTSDLARLLESICAELGADATPAQFRKRLEARKWSVCGQRWTDPDGQVHSVSAVDKAIRRARAGT